MITLDLPPKLQETVMATANAQGISINDYIVNAISTSLENDIKSIDDVMVFDMEVMQERLKGFKSREEALKNGLLLPQGLGREGLMTWLNDNLPKPAENKL
ncbi:toxin-antitoxin system HicB family antitoxin [Moraxella oblonga]|uniref:toxin-antitoxin system HicB family antitoxin n=1 Tax=Moraxella oblonga TaxID=200413 RepID=UPI0008328ADE|nr:toxin-antitoxin system HicB family antitoxin [Moraxella oblonga]